MEQKFELKLRRRDLSADELLADVIDTCKKLKTPSITRVAYEQHGQFSVTSVVRRFGTWNKALQAAGLIESNRYNIPNEELFENLASVWTKLGRQPYYSDLNKSNGVSNFSVITYSKRFGSWNKALLAFVDHVNTDEKSDESYVSEFSASTIVKSKRTGRTINWRLRAQVLIRDNCICKMCGSSPAKDPLVQLHVDHVFPWSKGGETVAENLQTLCAVCNIGKSDEIF
jgi:HNH endonuclease/Homing endonuclease associated repeat